MPLGKAHEFISDRKDWCGGGERPHRGSSPDKYLWKKRKPNTLGLWEQARLACEVGGDQVLRPWRLWAQELSGDRGTFEKSRGIMSQCLVCSVLKWIRGARTKPVSLAKRQHPWEIFRLKHRRFWIKHGAEHSLHWTEHALAWQAPQQV